MTRGSDPTSPAAVVRRAKSGDAELLAGLGARLFEQTFGDDNSPDDMRRFLDETFNRVRLTEELEDRDRVAWVAEADGAAIGYATVRRGVAADGVSGTKPVELQRIYVDHGHHGTGLGRRPLEMCVAQARAWGGDVIWLGVWERNLRAIAFYEKVGVRCRRESRFRRRDGCPARHRDVPPAPLKRGPVLSRRGAAGG